MYLDIPNEEENIEDKKVKKKGVDKKELFKSNRR